MAYIWKYEYAKTKVHKQVLPVKPPSFDAVDIKCFIVINK